MSFIAIANRNERAIIKVETDRIDVLRGETIFSLVDLIQCLALSAFIAAVAPSPAPLARAGELDQDAIDTLITTLARGPRDSVNTETKMMANAVVKFFQLREGLRLHRRRRRYQPQQSEMLALLARGDRVEFEVATGRSGRPEAVDVKWVIAKADGQQ